MDCYLYEGPSQKFVTVTETGYFIWSGTTPSPALDADTFVAEPADGGDEAGADAPDAAIDCRVCEEGGCDGARVSGCAILGRTPNRVYLRCDLEYHEVCVPKGVICGRRPEQFVRTRTTQDSPRPLGDLLAEMASLEAASVTAFHVLARELEAHRAPRVLCRAAERAAGDEVRHARTMSRLALRHGGSPIAVRVRQTRGRSLRRIAIENCVEGCVRETFGALVATWQAREARDPELRRAMQVIARDETRHAALAFRVAAWIDARLDSREKARIVDARKRAITALRRELAWDPPHELVTAAGVPTSKHALELLERAARALWAA